MYMEFTTRRCDIKKFIPEYISIMYDSFAKDRDTGMYLLDFKENMTLDDYKQYILGSFKPEYNELLVVQEKATNEIIGYIDLYKEDSRSKSVILVIKKDKWGKGFGTEVLQKLAELEKKNGLGSLYAACDEHNIGAQNVLEAAGFELIDNIPGDRVDLDGNVGDEFLYELEMIRVKYDT